MATVWYASRWDEVTHYKTLLSYINGKIAGNRKSIRAFNRMGSLHNYIDSMKENLLHHSAMSDDTSTTRWLIDYGLDINAQNKEGNTPLMLAAKKRKENNVCVLLKAGAEIDIDDYSGKNVLEKITNEIILNTFIPGALLMKLVDKCETVGEAALKLLLVKCPLNVAVLMKNAKLITYFLKHRPSDMINQSPLPAIHVAVHYESSEIVKLFLDHGTDVNVRDSTTRTPLNYIQNTKYSANEQLKILKLLLSKAPNLITDVEAVGFEQIVEVVHYGPKEVINFLLQANLDLRVDVYGDGLNLLHVLSTNLNPGVFEVVPRNYPMDIDAQGICRYTAVHLAVLYGNFDAIRFLMDRGAKVDLPDEKMWTPLFLAVSFLPSKPIYQRKIIECFELLIQYGADVQMLTNLEIKTILDVIFEHKSLYMIPPVLAHLALLEAKGTIIKNEIRAQISSDDRLAKPFDFLKEQLKQIRETLIIEPVTMFELLTESESKLLIYLRNLQFVLNLEQTGYRKNQGYFYEKLQMRIGCALQKVQLKQRAAAALTEIMEITYDSHPVVIDKILSFLIEEDLQQLSQI